MAVVARAGALLALVMAFRLARRLVGPGVLGVVAGLAAAAFLVTTYQFVRDSMLGNSEALLAALALWSFERHLDGRHDHAFYLAFAAGLLRPEVWPFLGAYGLWLWFREPELRLRIAAAGALIPLLWFGPELWGSGEPLRASSRANNPNPGSAAFAEHPGVEVVKRFHDRGRSCRSRPSRCSRAWWPRCSGAGGGPRARCSRSAVWRSPGSGWWRS